jgi:DNA polymerase-3 subunit epsilon
MINITQTHAGPRLSGSAYVVADCETTGVDPLQDRVVEFALVRFRAGRPMERFAALVDPGIAIPPVASAVHNFTNRDVAGKPTLAEYAADIAEFVADDEIVAHNASFDMKFLTMIDADRWICSYRLSRHLWPASPRHSNAVLRYVLRLDERHDLSQIRAHQAESDCHVTGLIFHEQLRELERRGTVSSIDAVRDYAWSMIPVTHLAFGKFSGVPLANVELDYLQWLHGEQKKPPSLRKASLDADTLHAVEDAITRRLFPKQFQDAISGATTMAS